MLRFASDMQPSASSICRHPLSSGCAEWLPFRDGAGAECLPFNLAVKPTNGAIYFGALLLIFDPCCTEKRRVLYRSHAHHGE
jgi:hypothetical protein